MATQNGILIAIALGVLAFLAFFVLVLLVVITAAVLRRRRRAGGSGRPIVHTEGPTGESRRGQRLDGSPAAAGSSVAPSPLAPTSDSSHPLPPRG